MQNDQFAERKTRDLWKKIWSGTKSAAKSAAGLARNMAAMYFGGGGYYGQETESINELRNIRPAVNVNVY